MPHLTTRELFALPAHEAHALLTDQELAHARKALAADVLERAREQGFRSYDKAEADNIVDGRIEWTLYGSCEACEGSGELYSRNRIYGCPACDESGYDISMAATTDLDGGNFSRRED